MSLLSLPAELISSVVQYLPKEDVLTLCRCKPFHREARRLLHRHTVVPIDRLYGKICLNNFVGDAKSTEDVAGNVEILEICLVDWMTTPRVLDLLEQGFSRLRRLDTLVVSNAWYIRDDDLRLFLSAITRGFNTSNIDTTFRPVRLRILETCKFDYDLLEGLLHAQPSIESWSMVDLNCGNPFFGGLAAGILPNLECAHGYAEHVAEVMRTRRLSRARMALPVSTDIVSTPSDIGQGPGTSSNSPP
ncbi:hypothetical protein JAAARDRAFT_195454 [Jaapia argillacea MUCL 33604]|uniref:F-box domain-containing protein n=1 Tax=Jaapia argillacea MUCL 33604 TaxID=933084 RepID=A0A067PZ32_9AGAM|nr:hypothetical protein JAAARDRAFT_195454 [Jaapia argillacea MUCL 33604]